MLNGFCTIKLLNYHGRLSGTTLAQTYVYYHNYRQDPILNKCAVGILWYFTRPWVQDFTYLPLIQLIGCFTPRFFRSCGLHLQCDRIWEYSGPENYFLVVQGIYFVVVYSHRTSPRKEQLQALLNVVVILSVHSCVQILITFIGF